MEDKIDIWSIICTLICIVALNILIGNMVKDPDRRTPEYKAGLKDCINNNGNKLDGQTFELGNNAKTLYWKGFKQAERDIKAEILQ